MVACLERTDRNAKFHQIMDFLTTSPIHYALTVSPTIYASYIEQFWATAKSKTVNDVKKIHATVDSKTVVISESSVRSDLHFNDEHGITCLSNDEIFVNLALIGTHTLGEPKRVDDTEIPRIVGPHKKYFMGLSIKRGDRVVRAATTATSLEAEQESWGTSSGSGPRCPDTKLGDADAQTRFKTASKQSRDPPLSEVNTSGSGEDRMEHQDDLIDFVLPTPYDSPLLGGHTPRSDEGRPNINELMAICIKLSNKVTLETSKTAQDLRKSLDKENVSKQGRNLKTRSMFEEGDFDDEFDDTDDMVNEEMENVEGDTVNDGGAVNTATTGVSAARAPVTTAGVSISTAEPRTPPTTTTTAFEDEDLTIAQTLVKMRSEKAKEKGVAFKDVEESARSTKILPTIDPKDKGKGIMQEPEKPPKNP
ncbi:hypothetical protein Tco_1258340 [Tanacetum coccineum]